MPQALAELVDLIKAKIDHVCPPRDKTDFSEEMKVKMRSSAYGYSILWSMFQMIGFMAILTAFLASDHNEYNKVKTCCTTDSTSTRTDGNYYNIPLEICSQPSCELYDFVFDDDRDFFQDRPRRPQNGDHSLVFELLGKQFCCNLSESNDQCCDRIPWGYTCTALMFAAAFSAIWAMLMSQVILQGFYSFSTRKADWHMIPAVFGGSLLRVLIFCVQFYVFWGFMFTFMFFGVAMFWCDNPYAWEWYSFGSEYVRYWFEHFVDIWGDGATKPWDGRMDIGSMVGAHSIYAICCDFVFAVTYLILRQYYDPKTAKPYLDLTFFDL